MGSHSTTTHPRPARPGRPPTDSDRTRRRRALELAVVASLGLALAACGGNDEDAAGDALDTGLAGVAAEASGDGAVAVEESAGESDIAGVPSAPTFDLGAIGRDVIVELQVAMSSDDIARTVTAISSRAAALGGGVASSNVDYGDPEQPGTTGFATLVVKVPPAAVDDLVGSLDDTGTVRTINQSAQDVTDQLVDLDVRIANARQSVTNVREFMDRTQDLTQLVTLEGELTRRQTELEQFEAQQRNLSDRVALSTVTIGIVPTASVPETNDEGGIAGAFADGWSAFVTVVVGIVVVLAALTPFVVTAALIAALGWWATRRRRRSIPAHEAMPVPPAPPITERDDVPTPTG